jgi:hypothetical protein
MLIMFLSARFVAWVCVGIIMVCVDVAMVFILYVLISIGLKVIVALAKILYNIKVNSLGLFPRFIACYAACSAGAARSFRNESSITARNSAT